MRLKNFKTSCRDKLYHHKAIKSSLIFWSSYLSKCPPANFCLCLALSQKSKVPVAYGKNSVSDLGISNDVTTNDVNVRIGNKTWWKCECCIPMETSIEGVCCLEITEICKRRFSSRFSSSLNFCRSDPHFVLWYFRWENFVSYLISIQCWSLANQNKRFLSLQTSWLSFSVKHFTLLIRSFPL